MEEEEYDGLLALMAHNCKCCPHNGNYFTVFTDCLQLSLAIIVILYL